MEVWDIGLLISTILPPVVEMMTMKVLKKNFSKCLRVRKVLDIGLLRTTTLPQVIVKVMKVLEIGLNIPENIPQLTAEVVNIGQLLPYTLPLVIVEDMLLEADLGHKRPSSLIHEIRKNSLC